MPRRHAAQNRVHGGRKKTGFGGAAAMIFALFLVFAVSNTLIDSSDDNDGGKTPESTSPSYSYQSDSEDTPAIDTSSGETASVHFINVGQGDCELIVSDDGTTMLIDGGEAEYGDTVVAYLSELGITRLDYIVATHPHSDHIGGLRKVISSSIEIGQVIMPELPDEYIPTTNSYEKLLDAIEAEGCPLYAAENESFSFGGGTITVTVSDYSSNNINNYSVVIRFDYGETSFLFTGDIEKAIETQLVENESVDLDVDILKVPHHGSSTSSSYAFLDAVTPEYCIIECGDSSYNHPNADTVERLSAYTGNILRTDVDGGIIVTCTADGYTVSTGH